jgi:hypothetical protein
MSYRIKETDPAAGRSIVELTSCTGNAHFFRSAEWRFDVQPAVEGASLTCSAVFSLRWNDLSLAPVLYLGRKQIMIDLECLKLAVESQKVEDVSSESCPANKPG